MRRWGRLVFRCAVSSSSSWEYHRGQCQGARPPKTSKILRVGKSRQLNLWDGIWEIWTLHNLECKKSFFITTNSDLWSEKSSFKHDFMASHPSGFDYDYSAKNSFFGWPKIFVSFVCKNEWPTWPWRVKKGGFLGGTRGVRNDHITRQER